MANIFTIKIDGKERDIKMSFGLLNTICKLVGDLDGATQLMIDQTLQQAVLVELLSDRDAKGKITGEVSLDEIDVDPSDVLDLLAWAGNHTLDFFLKGLERAKGLQDQHMPRVKALTPSPSGS